MNSFYFPLSILRDQTVNFIHEKPNQTKKTKQTKNQANKTNEQQQQKTNSNFCAGTAISQHIFSLK